MGSRRKDRPTGGLEGDTVSFAFGINEKARRWVLGVGSSNTTLPPNAAPGGPHAVWWEKDGWSPISARSREVPKQRGDHINGRGEVVGTALLSDGTFHAFLWTRQRGMEDFGVPANDFVTSPPAATPSPTVVRGWRFVSWPSRWRAGDCLGRQGPRGPQHADPGGSPWYFQFASSINDAGRLWAGAP